MLSIRCFWGVGWFSSTKCNPALSATFRYRIGLSEATPVGTALCLWIVGSKKAPRPEARNCLRLVLSFSFIPLLLSNFHHAIRQNERQSLEKEENSSWYPDIAQVAGLLHDYADIAPGPCHSSGMLNAARC